MAHQDGDADGWEDLWRPGLLVDSTVRMQRGAVRICYIGISLYRGVVPLRLPVMDIVDAPPSGEGSLDARRVRARISR